MEKEVYVSGVRQENLGKLAKVIIEIFDKKGDKDSFSTSLMTKYNAEKYISTLLNVAGKDSWFKVFFGLNPLEFAVTIDEEQNEIVALSNDKATLFKNEIVLSKNFEILNNNSSQDKTISKASNDITVLDVNGDFTLLR